MELELDEEAILEEKIKKLTIDILYDREDCSKLGINYVKAANPTKEMIEKAKNYAIKLLIRENS